MYQIKILNKISPVGLERFESDRYTVGSEVAGEDGIVVRGAKAHQTGMCNSHQVLVMPTQAMGPDDKDYAVSFSAPADAEGLFMIVGRQSCDTRKLENTDIDVGNAQYGGVELLVVNALRFRPHPSHFNVEEALALIARVAPRRALITHVSHEIGRHAATTALLPRGVELAYDGLEIII